MDDAKQLWTWWQSLWSGFRSEFTLVVLGDLIPSRPWTYLPNAARFRQEDGFRDHQQRLGMEDCRAWTKEPILRTFQVQILALTLLRLIQFRLDAAHGAHWRPAPPWNLGQRHASLLDLRRRFWKHRARCSQLITRLHDLRKPTQTKFYRGQQTARAA